MFYTLHQQSIICSLSHYPRNHSVVISSILLSLSSSSELESSYEGQQFTYKQQSLKFHGGINFLEVSIFYDMKSKSLLTKVLRNVVNVLKQELI